MGRESLQIFELLIPSQPKSFVRPTESPCKAQVRPRALVPAYSTPKMPFHVFAGPGRSTDPAAHEDGRGDGELRRGVHAEQPAGGGPGLHVPALQARLGRPPRHRRLPKLTPQGPGKGSRHSGTVYRQSAKS